jgi:hypothetical protein
MSRSFAAVALAHETPPVFQPSARGYSLFSLETFGANISRLITSPNAQPEIQHRN